MCTNRVKQHIHTEILINMTNPKPWLFYAGYLYPTYNNVHDTIMNYYGYTTDLVISKRGNSIGTSVIVKYYSTCTGRIYFNQLFIFIIGIYSVGFIIRYKRQLFILFSSRVYQKNYM